jgi:hypothetical protein
VAQINRGRVSDPAQAALSGSHNEVPGSAGGNLTICLQPRPYLRPHRRLRNPPDPCSRSSPTPNGSTGHSRISAAYSTTHTSDSHYDKRPRKTHPLTPTKQAAGSPRSGRVIRYGLRDGRRRGIDATKLRFHSRCARQSTRYKGFIHWILAIPTILLAGKVAMNGVLQMRCWKAQAPGAFMRMQVGDLEF